MKNKLALLILLILTKSTLVKADDTLGDPLMSPQNQEPSEQQYISVDQDEAEKVPPTYPNPNREIINFYPSDDDHPERGTGVIDRPYLKMLDKSPEQIKVEAEKKAEDLSNGLKNGQNSETILDPAAEKLYVPVQGQ